METRKFILTQALTVLLGQLILSGIMVAVFAALGYYDRSVLLGAAVGVLIAALNHLILVLSVLAASGKAEKQDVKGGHATVRLSYLGRLVGMFLILALCAKSKQFNLPALVIPLLFTAPILTIAGYFSRKKGGTTP